MAIEFATTDETKFELEVAGLGSRTLAWLVDAGLKYGAMILVMAAANLISPRWPYGLLGLGTKLQVVLLLSAVFLHWAYYWLFEWLWHGRTPGKRAQNIQVIKENGQPPGLVAAAVRNLLRPLDFTGIGPVVMFLTPKCKRLGDLVAGTVVVYEHPVDLGVLAELSEQPILEGEPITINPDLFEILQDFVNRRNRMSTDARGHLANRLAQVLTRRIPPRQMPDGLNPEQLVEYVLARARVVRQARS